MNDLKNEDALSESSMADGSSQHDLDTTYEFVDAETDSSSNSWQTTDESDSDEEEVKRPRRLMYLGISPIPNDQRFEMYNKLRLMKDKNSRLQRMLRDYRHRGTESDSETTETAATETPCDSAETETIIRRSDSPMPATQTETIASSCEGAEKSQEDLSTLHLSDVDPRDVQIKFLSVTNEAMKAKIELLEKHAPTNDSISLDQCSIRRMTSQANIDNYVQKAKEMNDCFVSTQSRYIEEQAIVRDCVNIIHAIEGIKLIDKSLNKIDFSEYEKMLTNYRKKLTYVQIQIMEDRQKMISVEKHYQKILSDYRHLVRELDTIELEMGQMNSIDKQKQEKYAEMEKSLDERTEQLNEEKASLIKQQKTLIDEKAFVHIQLQDMTNKSESLEKEKEQMSAERKGFQNVRELVDNQGRLYEIETSRLKAEIILLSEKCDVLTEKHDAMKAENDAMHMEKNKLSEALESLKKLNIFLSNQLQSLHKEYEDLMKETVLLTTRFNINQLELDNFKDRFAQAQNKLEQLETKNIELEDAASVGEVYKIQAEEQAIVNLEMIETENNYLRQISKLANENRELQEENKRLKNQ